MFSSVNGETSLFNWKDLLSADKLEVSTDFCGSSRLVKNGLFPEEGKIKFGSKTSNVMALEKKQ